LSERQFLLQIELMHHHTGEIREGRDFLFAGRRPGASIHYRERPQAKPGGRDQWSACVKSDADASHGHRSAAESLILGRVRDDHHIVRENRVRTKRGCPRRLGDVEAEM
jgi:hypothetical protein